MYKQIASGALKAIALSVAGNVLLFYLLHAVGAISDLVIIPDANGPLTVMPVAIASALPLIIASVVYMLLARFTSNPMSMFRIIALTLLLLSFGSPFSIPQVTVPMALSLNAMHVVSVVSLLIFLPTVKKADYTS